MVSKRVVLADVPPERKLERRYIRMLPRNENRNEGTCTSSPGTKTRTSFTKTTLYETALLSTSDSVKIAGLKDKTLCLSRSGLILVCIVCGCEGMAISVLNLSSDACNCMTKPGAVALDGPNRQSPIASVQRTPSTLASHSAFLCGTNVARMDANRAIGTADNERKVHQD